MSIVPRPKNHSSECGRNMSVANTHASGRPHRSVRRYLPQAATTPKSLSTEDCYILWLRRYMTPRIREIACDVFIHSVYRLDSCAVLPPQTIKLHSHHIHISTEECNRTGRISCNVHPRSKNAWG